MVRRLLGDHRHLIEQLESRSLLAVSGDRAREVRAEAQAAQERLIRLARAGYTPLSCMPPGSYVAPDFDRLGEQVNELLRRVRRVVDHCNQIDNLVKLREQADMDRDHRRRFPREMLLLEEQRDILGALYPDRWLLLFDGAIRGEYDTVQEALRRGEDDIGRDSEGRPRFLIFCHRAPARQ